MENASPTNDGAGATPAETTTASAETTTATAESSQTGSLLGTTTDTPQETAPVEERPEWLPENFWRNGKADVQALAKSYRGMQEILGRKSQSVLIPNEKSKPEEIAEFRKAMGVPEKPEDYIEAIKPQQMPEGIAFDEAMAKKASELAHKHNIPPAAMKDLAALQLAQQQAAVAQYQQAFIAKLNEGKASLEMEFGEKMPEKIELAKRVALTAGIDPSSSGFTDPNMVRLALWAAEKISDDKLVAANSNPMQASHDQAKDIMTNPSNPLYARYREGDEDVVAKVRSLLTRK